MDDVVNKIGIEFIVGGADRAAKSISSVEKALRSLKKLEAASTSGSKAVQDMSNSLSKLGKVLKTGGIVAGVMAVLKGISKFTNRSSAYIEDINLFTQSMGKYADRAYAFGEKVADVMGIDIGPWLKNQGVFMTLAKGFGVAGDRAYVMSQQLTQLGYDIASFFNLDIDEAMKKVQSGLAGELEPMRRIGYDLSKVRLNAIAAKLELEKTFDEMDQSEKSQLRYYAMMTQVTVVQGDMARTLQAPANQLRILKAQFEMAARAIGNIFIPVLNAILPIAIAVVKAIRMIAEALAGFFGYQLPEVSWEGAVESTAAIEDNLDKANGRAKKLKKQLAGFDEINNLTTNDSGSGSGIIPNKGGLDFDLPTYDFLKGAVSSAVDDIYKKLEPFVTWFKENLDDIFIVVGGISAALAAWKIKKTFIKGIDALGGIINREFSKSVLKNFGTSIDSFAPEVQKKIASMWAKSLGGGLLLSVGVGVSFFNSKNIGKTGEVSIGNVIYQAVGAGLSAIGGWLLFGGPTGIAIGLGLQITASIIGFAIGENKRLSTLVSDAFYAENPNGVHIKDVAIVFDNFTTSLTLGMTDIVNASAEVDTLKTKITETNTEIAKIGGLINGGAIEVGDGITQMQSSYKTLYEDTKTTFNQTYNVIYRALGTVWNEALKEQGKDVETMKEYLKQLQSSGNEAIDSIGKQMDDVTKQFADGKIGIEEYSLKMGDLQERLNKINGVTNDSAWNVEQLSEKLKNVDWGNPEEASAAMNSLKESAANAKTDVNLTFDTLDERLKGAKQMAIALGQDTSVFDDLLQVNAESREKKLNEIDTELGKIFDGLSLSLAEKTKDVEEKALTDWNNLNWFTKLWYGDQEIYVNKAVGNYKSNIVVPLVNKMTSAMEELGADVGEGYLKGAQWYMLGEANRWREFARTPEAYVTQEMDIHSPSKVMFDLGVDISAGLLNGIEAGSKDASKSFDGLLTSVKSISDNVKSPFNSIIGAYEKLTNAVIKGNNSMIRSLNKIKVKVPDWVPEYGGKSWKFDLSTSSEASLPRLASGGLVNNPTVAMIGESGSEAVVPLERNTGWMKTLATTVNSESNPKQDVIISYLGKIIDAIGDMDVSVSISDDYIGKAAKRYEDKRVRIQGV